MAFRFLSRSTKSIRAFNVNKSGKGFFIKKPTYIFRLNSHHLVGINTVHGNSLFRGWIQLMGIPRERVSNINGNTNARFWFLTSVNVDSYSLSEKNIDMTTNTKKELRRPTFNNMDFKVPLLHRMISTSSTSHQSGSKLQDEKKDDFNISTTMKNVIDNSTDKSNSAQVMDVENGNRGKISFQSMLRQYGKVFIATYIAVYVSTVLGLFASLQSGQLDAIYIISLLTGSSSPAEPGGVADPDTIKEATSAMNDLVKLLESYRITRPVAPMVEQYPWTANFAIAWIATKFTEPIRFGVTVLVTPPLSKYFGRRFTPAAVESGPIQVVSKRGDTSSASNSTKL